LNRYSAVVALLTAKAISDVGFALDFVCLSVFVWVRTGSALATGLLGLCLYVGGIVGGRLGQRYGAQWDRRRAMIVADVVRAAALVVLTAVPAAVQLAWLFPTVLAIGAGRSVFEATLAAGTPALVGPARAQAINGTISGIKGVALVLGMGLATVAVPTVGFRAVFAMDAASYALSAAVLLTVPLRLRDEGGDARAARRGKGGWGVLLASGLATMVLVRGLDAFGSASHHVGLPLLGAVLDPANPASVVGAVWMAWAAGTLVGSFVLRPLLAGVIDRAPVSTFGLATAVMSAGFIGIFWVGSWVGMLAAAAIAGLGDALSEITFRQALQALPDANRGGAFGTAQIVVNVGFAVGLLSVGAIATTGRIGILVIVMHGVAMFAAAGLAVRFLRTRKPAPATWSETPAAVGSTEQ
jgi:MFS family permease